MDWQCPVILVHPVPSTVTLSPRLSLPLPPPATNRSVLCCEVKYVVDVLLLVCQADCRSDVFDCC